MLKLILIIFTILLVGCFTSSQISYKNSEQIVSTDIDKKLKELQEEQKKLEEIENRLKEVQIPKPILKSTPHPAPSSPKNQAGAAGLFDHRPKITPRERLSEPVGSGSKSTPVSQINVPIKTLPSPDSVVSQLYEANAVFAIPNKANVTEEIQAQLIIDPVKTVDELKKDVTAGPIKSAEKIEVSKIVIAQLNAPDFHIISSTEPEQAIAETKSTEWIWTLKPKTSGLHSVNIVVYAEVTVGKKTTKYKIQTFDKQVIVEITPIQVVSKWWEQYWQWIFVTLLIPFGKWLYDKKFGQSKERATEVAL